MANGELSLAEAQKIRLKSKKAKEIAAKELAHTVRQL
jgi:hypothetical protein